MIKVFIVLLIFVYFYCCKTSHFSTFYSNVNRTGTKFSGKKSLLYDTEWRIYAADAPKDSIFMITAKDNSAVLFLRSPGKINNLPAAIGALPAHDNYKAIFNSGTPVYIEIIDLGTAVQKQQALKSLCIETASSEYCENEFTSLQ